MLELSGVAAGYGKIEIVREISFAVPDGATVALIGPNGAGKSTILRAIAGLASTFRGTVRLGGLALDGLPTASRARAGLGYVPQGSALFPELTVLETLEVGALLLKHQERRRHHLAAVLELFPDLTARLHDQATELSGGQRQMLALARAVVAEPTTLLLDEPSLGLAPGAARAVIEHVRNLRDRHGLAILLAEQNVNEATRVADQVIGLKLGRVVAQGRAEAFQDREALRRLFL